MKPYKRSKSEDSTWYVQFIHDGKRVQYNTRKTDYQEAVTEGMRAAAEQRLGVHLKAEAPPGKTNIQSVVSIYEEQAIHLDNASKKKNISNLRKVIAASGLNFSDPPHSLSRKVVIAFQRSWVKEHPGGSKSANSMLRQARSVFAKRCMPLYEELALPDLSGFMEQPLLKETRSQYTPLPEATQDRVCSAAVQLKQDNPPVYAAFVLAMYTGMRAGEILEASWEWLKEATDGSLYFELPAEVCKSGASRLIPVSQEAVAELRAVSGESGYIVTGNSPTARKRAIYRDHSKWLRLQGLTTKKTNHELRKLFGATMATEQGLYAAQTVLGHANPQLTSDYYAALTKMPAPRAMRTATAAAGPGSSQEQIHENVQAVPLGA